MTQAHWVSRDTIAWRVDGGGANSYLLHHDPDGALHPGSLGDARDTAIRLTYDPAGLSPDILAKFPHLAWFSALKLSPDDLSKVPEILRGQIAVSASEPSGRLLDAASVQIPGVLDHLYV